MRDLSRKCERCSVDRLQQHTHLCMLSMLRRPDPPDAHPLSAYGKAASRVRHTSPSGKGGEDRIRAGPVTGGAPPKFARLHLPSPPDHAKRVQKPSGQIEAFDLARTRTPSCRSSRKNQKSHLFHSDTTDPRDAPRDEADLLTPEATAPRARTLFIRRAALPISLRDLHIPLGQSL
jgi:hypothetical protein